MAFLDDLLNNIKKTAVSVGTDAAKGVNTGLGLVQQSGSALDQAVAQAIGNKQLAAKFAQQQQNTLLKKGNGLFGQGGLTNAQDLGHVSGLQALGSGANAGVQYAPYFVGGGGGALTTKLGGTVASKIAAPGLSKFAGQASRIGANAAISAPVFAGIEAIQQGADSGFRQFDPNRANIAGLQAGLSTAVGDIAPIAVKGLAKGTKAAAIKGSEAAGDALQASRDAELNKVASQVGQPANFNHSDFDPDLVKSASERDIKAAKSYYKQLQQGKDLGRITTTINERGFVEPSTKDGLQKYLALKAADNSIPAKTANDFTHSRYANVATNHVDDAMLRNGLEQYRMQTQGGYVQLPGGSDKPPLYSATSVPNKLTQGARAGRQNLSDETIANLDGQHTVRSTQALNDNAVAAADKLSTNDLVSQANERLSVPAGNVTDADVAFTKQAIERADAEGNHQAASTLHDSLSEQLVAHGQAVQAASLLYNRTPQGLLYKGLRDIKKATGDSVDDATRAKLQGLADDIKNAADGDAKTLAAAKFQKEIQNHIPQGKLQGALSVWKAGLLSSPITHAGNILSNATFGGLNKVSDIPASIADAGIGLFTGKRTKTFSLHGIATGTGEGVENALTTLKSGIDRRNIINNKYEGHGELNFKNPVIQKVFGDTSNGVFRLLGASDQPFYYAAARNSLYDQAKALAKTEGVPLKDRSAFINDKVKNPTTKMAQQAENDAKTAVLGEDSVIGSAVSKFTQAHPALQVLVPFTKVPTNFIKQAVQYTPVGPIASAFKQIKNVTDKKGFDQRAFATAIGKGATGSSVIALGAGLSAAGALSGQYPSTDQKEAQRWKAQGITPNSVHIGNQWLSLNYLGPVGILLQAGKDLHDGDLKDGNGAVDAAAGLGKTLAGQSFLTGLSGVANAVNDPQQSAGSYINSQANSLVPGLVRVAANASDPTQRQVNNPLQSIQNGIPGVRTGLNPKQDVYGNGLNQRTDPTNLVLNPLRPSNDVSSTTLNEVARLRNADPNNKDLEVTPTPIDKTVTVDGKKYPLSDQQKYDLQNTIGQATQQAWAKLIQTKDYQSLSDADKAKALNNLRTDTTALAQRGFVQSNNIAQYKKDLTGSQKDLQSGSVSLSDYAKSSNESASASSSKSTLKINDSLDSQSKSTLNQYKKLSTADRTKLFDSQNDAEYQYDLAKYKNDVANGTLSKAQQAKVQSSLATEQIGANFDKQTRDLYGLSKQQLYSVLSKDPDGNALAQKVVAYGDALENAGVSSNKFRNSKGSVSIQPSSISASKAKNQSTKAGSIAPAGNTATLAAFKIAKSAKVNGGKKYAANTLKAKTGLQAYKKPTKQKIA